ncbi:unnamed protein product, partial [Mesorhabditis spiculigera]
MKFWVLLLLAVLAVAVDSCKTDRRCPKGNYCEQNGQTLEGRCELLESGRCVNKDDCPPHLGKCLLREEGKPGMCL